MEVWYWAILVVGCVPLYLLAGWAIFEDWSGFAESIRLWFTPEIISVFRGEWEEDRWAQLKIVFFLGTCAAMVAGVHFLLMAVFGQGAGGS